MDRTADVNGFVGSAQFRVGFEAVRRDDTSYFLPEYARHRPAVRRFLDGQVHEPHTRELVRIVLAHRPGSVIHAGAFFGDMLPSFSAACSGTVYAFEPVLENFVLADLCVQANDLANVVLLRAALGDRVGTASMATTDTNGRRLGGGSRIAAAGQTVPMLTIDCLRASDVSVLVLDAKGYELPVLLGARQTVQDSQPVILVEDNLQMCPPLLTSWDYQPIGTVHGLHLWAAAEDAAWLVGAHRESTRDEMTGREITGHELAGRPADEVAG